MLTEGISRRYQNTNLVEPSSLKPEYSVYELIQELYTEPDFNKRKYIPDKLAKMGDWVAVPHLGRVLTDPTEPVALRNECAESIGKLGDIRGLKFLGETVFAKDKELRRTSIWSVGQIGAEAGIDILAKCQNDEYEMSRRWVAKSLGRINSKMAVSILKEFYSKTLLRDGEMGTEIRVINDTLRAVTNQVKQLSSKDHEFWIEEGSKLLSKTERRVTILTILQLFTAITSQNPKVNKQVLEIFQKQGVKEKLENTQQRLLYYSYISQWGEISYDTYKDLDGDVQIGITATLAEAGKTVELRELLTHNPPESFFKGLIVGSISARYRCVLSQAVLEFVLHNTDTSRLTNFDFEVTEFRLITNPSIKTITAVLDSSYKNVAVRALRVLQPSKELVNLLETLITDPDKKIRETTLQSIRRLKERYPKNPDVRLLLLNVFNLERIWHMRKDARLSLISD